MNPQHHPQSKPDLPVPPLTSLWIQPTSPRVPLTVTPTAGAQRRITIIVDLSDESSYASQQKLENESDLFTMTKANTLTQPLVDAKILFKIDIVKDHDLKERLCLEVERLGLSAVIMESRGFGATRRTSKGRLGSVNDYCIHHCICPVVVIFGEDAELQPVPKEELEDYDAEEEYRGLS
uniref:UspA domain-containing protein n=1 Tax=Gossypium raimondii TaxID=29730 RepID=A0A0D2TWR1_GOSRA|nr:hypothetical protein B456_013G071500 [Gossypium raimondii]